MADSMQETGECREMETRSATIAAFSRESIWAINLRGNVYKHEVTWILWVSKQSSFYTCAGYGVPIENVKSMFESRELFALGVILNTSCQFPNLSLCLFGKLELRLQESDDIIQALDCPGPMGGWLGRNWEVNRGGKQSTALTLILILIYLRF